MRYGHPFAALTLAALFVRCAPEGREVAAARASIAGGYEDATDAAVVGFRDMGGNATCTGSLIASNLVLLAQHCVARVPTGPLTPTTVFGATHPVPFLFVTTQATFGARRQDYHGVSEVIVPPGERTVFGEDIALVVLSEPVAPSEARPIAPRLDAPPDVGERYAAVGYGATSAFGTDNDRRRRRDDRLVACVGRACNGGRGYATEWIGGDGPCAGDSGGPALDAEGRVIGVMARGGVNCVLPTYTLVTAYRTWLVAEARRVAQRTGEPLPAWADEASADRGADAAVTEADADATDAADTDTAETPVADAHAADASSADAAPPRSSDVGGCRAGPTGHAGAPARVLFALVTLLRARRARATGRGRRGRTGSCGADRGARGRRRWDAVGDDAARAPPFDPVELDLAALWRW